MFSLHQGPWRSNCAQAGAIPFLIAFAVAEFFFKFKSFALECLAFLAVWFVLSFVQSLVFPHSKEQRS